MSAAITAGGRLVGAVLGFAGAFGLTALMRAETNATVAAALAVGFAFGSNPTVRAARLSPVDAIRYE